MSIIIPTYNESKNIIQILQSIGDNIPKNIKTQAIVVDDNSPDGTGKIAEDYLKTVKKAANYTIDIIHRKTKDGLGSAILRGIQNATGETIVVMDSDFSHPPQIIPKMIEELKKYQCDIVVASRYINGGKINGWTIKRKLMSLVATKIAKKGLGIQTCDPMSGFFAFKKNILNELKLDAIGYKFLLELLVKTKNTTVKEIPYTFTNREFGSSKLGMLTIINYLCSVWKLYRFGNSTVDSSDKKSAKIISQAGRFYTVGASGFFVNYLLSLIFTDGLTNFWYLHANVIGIFGSICTNFILNKIWTFEDRSFIPKLTTKQFLKFASFSSIGALIQLTMVFYLIDEHNLQYPIALIVAVITASLGNFLFNKKWTFKQKIWK